MLCIYAKTVKQLHMWNIYIVCIEISTTPSSLPSPSPLKSAKCPTPSRFWGIPPPPINWFFLFFQANWLSGFIQRKVLRNVYTIRAECLRQQRIENKSITLHVQADQFRKGFTNHVFLWIAKIYYLQFCCTCRSNKTVLIKHEPCVLKLFLTEAEWKFCFSV